MKKLLISFFVISALVLALISAFASAQELPITGLGSSPSDPEFPPINGSGFLTPCIEKSLESRCFGNQLQRLFSLANCSENWFTVQTCAGGCSPNSDSGSAFCASAHAPQPVQPFQPPQQADNAPTVSISVPATASPSSVLSIFVTGRDDRDVDDLRLFDAARNELARFECEGAQTVCTHTFIRTAPATLNTQYTFLAKSEDNAGQDSAFASGTGTTTAAAAPVPVVPAPVSVQVAVQPAARPLQVVALKLPLQTLFMRSVSFPDSDCVRPGESALLAVKVRNTGKSTLKGVSFTATVPEVGIRSRSGPHNIKTTDKFTRFLRLDVPDDAAEGAYYLRLTVTNSKFSRTVYRPFAIDSGC